MYSPDVARPLPSGILFRGYRESDWEGVRALLEVCYGVDEEYAAAYRWWNTRCPVAESGFQVAEQEGRVVGVQPMLVGKWLRPGGEVLGGVLSGVVVHPDCRRRGVFSALVTACEQAAWEMEAGFVVTLPNEKSAPAFRKFGWRDLGDRTLLLRWAGGAVTRGKATEVEAIPPDVDELAARSLAVHSGLWLRRTGAWWRWRFAPSFRRYALAELRDRSGALIGLVSGTVRPSKGVPMGYLVDLVVANDDAVAPLVRTIGRALRGRGALGLAAVVSSLRLTSILQGAGFVRVPSWAPVKRFHTVAIFREGLGVGEMPPPSVSGWDLTLGDWDNI